MLKKNRKGYLYLLPALIILSVFVFYPIMVDFQKQKERKMI